MITGIHSLIYSKDAENDRAFFRDVLGFRAIDSGGGWLIFELPPAELAVHPGEEEFQEIYLMCDDIEKTINELQAKGVVCDEIHEARWGRATTVILPSGGKLRLYEPRHRTAINVG